MPGFFPFCQQGKTISLTAGVASQSRQVFPADFGLPAVASAPTGFPPHVRIVNRGTVDIWVSFTTASTTIAIPTPGTTTVGTPQQGFLILPGVIEIFTLPTGGLLWIQDISTQAGQTYHLTIGEGL
jgi:hypothetical protein